VRIPTFSRHSATDTAEDERPSTAAGSTTPVRERTDAPPRGTATVAGPSDETTTRWAEKDRADANRAEDRTAVRTREAVATREARGTQAERDAANRDANVKPTPFDPDRTAPVRRVEPAPVEAGPRPRASLLATLGLILAVASALLVLSGPLLGYGIGVAVLALILSLSGVHATGKRHVAGKSDALIGMFVALAAIVVGVLALTGSLSWLGTDMQPVSSAREWLDAQFANRF
jgi:hypothetical protein